VICLWQRSHGTRCWNETHLMVYNADIQRHVWFKSAECLLKWNILNCWHIFISRIKISTLLHLFIKERSLIQNMVYIFKFWIDLKLLIFWLACWPIGVTFFVVKTNQKMQYPFCGAVLSFPASKWLIESATQLRTQNPVSGWRLQISSSCVYDGIL
jgi:hypothetical protein